ncbi:2-dehydro-3-deoxyglucarate aldolase/4-hydroxy-2-oxoheptanedioate aldolase [Pullulanibacillus pueri]|uniref:Aldolase n=1 Tax=Pullulanibacillus pueri TaxID=1437324 RepID=A0A8J2ZV69_9BACL|nr:aldolase/citrate lyase family protein [Pullulanibacillus pueri]MBM7682097.1 2-dehydro-3-deoxyglucarate aldolase/4-hydroxy-2-oxoheptanedioate aldolase [Pullulanibacillus pueri]GGH79993.1 aldolase [Pullulanibacillus pueri]
MSILKNLKDSSSVYGTMLSEVNNVNIPRIFKEVGFDFYIIDCEHGYFNYNEVASLITVSKLLNLVVIVRIPKIDRECILKFLDMGADALLIPMVSSLDELKLIVDYSMYPPIGKRGVSTLRSHTNYKRIHLPEYMEMANKTISLLIQIETREGLNHINELASHPFIDGIIVGPNDLSVDLGIPGDYDNQHIKDAIQLVSQTAIKYNKWSGVISSNKKLLSQSKEIGMKFFSWSSELGMIKQSAADGLRQLK